MPRPPDLPCNPDRVGDVRLTPARGPWPSKCNGDLLVPVMLSFDETRRLLRYDADELARMEMDIRGIRVFYLDHAQAGAMAGNQFHRLRTEIAFVVEGAVHWEFEDLYGDVRQFTAAQDTSVFIPPFVLHRAIFGAGGGTLATLANTIYVKEDPRTHDTYLASLFHLMQQHMRAQRHAG